MTDRSLRAALITTDPRFRTLVRELLSAPESGLVLGADVAVPFAAYGQEQVAELRRSNPDLVILDLEDDPALGVKFTQFLVDMGTGHRVIATGPALSPDLLLGAMRAGVSDFLPKPVTSAALAEAIERVSLTMGRTGAKARKPGQIFAFFSPKGGSGSTTVCTNTAVVLHRLTGKRTLLVDLDLELGEVALLLGVQPRFNFVDMIQNFHRMDAGLLASYIEQHESGVHLLSAPFHPERAEATNGEEIRQILHFLRNHYDYIVVDTSKSFAPSTLAAFDQADLVFLVTNVDLPSLRNIQRGLPMLKRVLRRGPEQIRLVVNRYDPNNDISLADVERTLGLSVFGTVRNDYESVIQSLNDGKPLVLNGGKSKCDKDIRALASSLAGLKGATPEGSRIGRLVGRLRGGLHRQKGEAKS
jgi:pilus assembly protein CpaE